MEHVKGTYAGPAEKDKLRQQQQQQQKWVSDRLGDCRLQASLARCWAVSSVEIRGQLSVWHPCRKPWKLAEASHLLPAPSQTETDTLSVSAATVDGYTFSRRNQKKKIIIKNCIQTVYGRVPTNSKRHMAVDSGPCGGWLSHKVHVALFLVFLVFYWGGVENSHGEEHGGSWSCWRRNGREKAAGALQRRNCAQIPKRSQIGPKTPATDRPPQDRFQAILWG